MVAVWNCGEIIHMTRAQLQANRLARDTCAFFYMVSMVEKMVNTSRQERGQVYSLANTEVEN